MPSKRVTLADVAREAGMSKTAASMILNGRPDTRLSKAAHEKVHAAAARLGYRPNVNARALYTGRTRTLGLVSDEVATTRFATGLIRGALKATEAADHVLIVLETGGQPARETMAINAALDRQVDGLLFATMRGREVFVPELPPGTRAVMVNATSPAVATSVLPDEERGGRRAVEHLLDFGHGQGIALIGQSDDREHDVFRSANIERRVSGIRAAMAEHGLAFLAEESVWEWEPKNGYAIANKLLLLGDDLRAVVCLNDRLALGAYQAFSEAGRRVPEDISVVSFDDDEIAAYLRPGLTTVALPHEAMGALAVELLLDDGAEPGERLVPMPLIERASVGPASGRQVRADVVRCTGSQLSP